MSDNTNLRVDPDFENPYTDQFIVGFERELAKNLGLSVNYVHKRGRTYGGLARRRRGEYEPATTSTPRAPEPRAATSRVQRLLSDPADRVFLLTNPDGMFTRFNGVTVQLIKRMAEQLAGGGLAGGVPLRGPPGIEPASPNASQEATPATSARTRTTSSTPTAA